MDGPKEFRPPDTVDKAPENTPATKKPGKPGKSDIRSMTNRGNSWSLVETNPDLIGSQLT